MFTFSTALNSELNLLSVDGEPDVSTTEPQDISIDCLLHEFQSLLCFN